MLMLVADSSKAVVSYWPKHMHFDTITVLHGLVRPLYGITTINFAPVIYNHGGGGGTSTFLPANPS